MENSELELLNNITEFSDLLENLNDKSLTAEALSKLTDFSNRINYFLNNVHQSDEETTNLSQKIINEDRTIHKTPYTEMASFLDSWTEESLNSYPLIKDANEAISTLSITNNEILSFPQRSNIKSTNVLQEVNEVKSLHRTTNNKRTSLLDTPITNPIQVNEVKSLHRTSNNNRTSLLDTPTTNPIQEITTAKPKYMTRRVSSLMDLYYNTLNDYARLFAVILAYDPESFFFLSIRESNTGMSLFCCTVCSLTFNTPKEIANHITQAQHKYQVKKISIIKCHKKAIPEEDNYVLLNNTCEFCKISLPTLLEENNHKNTALHITYVTNWRLLTNELCRRGSNLMLEVPLAYLTLGPNRYKCIYCIEDISLGDVISHLSEHKDVLNHPISPQGFKCLTCNFQGNVYHESVHNCNIKLRIICFHCKYIIVSIKYTDISEHLLQHKGSNKQPPIIQRVDNSPAEDVSDIPLLIFDYFKSPYSLQTYLEQIIEIANRENQTVYLRHERVILFIKERVSKIFQGEMPEIFHIFGSRGTGMYLPGSDLDISIDLEPLIKKHQLTRNFELIASKLVSAFESAGHYEIENCHIPVATAPRIRFTHITTKTDVDLSFKIGVGIYNSRLLVLFAKIQPILISLVRIMKIWTKEYKLSGYPNFTSHALIMLIIVYMQTVPSPPLLPSVKEIKEMKCGYKHYILGSIEVSLPTDDSLGSLIEKYGENNMSSLHELTKNFLAFLVCTDFETQVISPYYGKVFPRTTFQTSTPDLEIMEYFIQAKSDSKTLIKECTGGGIPMVVQDSLDLTKNVTGHITKYTLENLKKLAAKTALIM